MKTGVIVVDKGEGWTSHDVVAKLRGILRERRIGHGGTLDPMATGVLPVFVGRATRAVELVTQAEKEYVAHMKLGLTTDTQDISGTVLTTCDALPSPVEVEAALEGFRGEIAQIPPMYSAVKKNGKKLYELARKGIEIEREARRVNISRLSLVQLANDEYELTVRCSKGTYIRTLCHDIGALLGCGAVMTQLRRTAAGGFTLGDAVTLEDIMNSDAPESFLRPVDGLFAAYPAVEIGSEDEKKLKNGAAFKTPQADGLCRVYASGVFMALCEARGGEMYTIKSFFEVQ